MKTFKFKSVMGFLTVLEKGPLYDESGRKYTMERNTNVSLKVNVVPRDNKEEPITIELLSTLEKHCLMCDFTPKPIPQDKDLVMCWNDSIKFKKTINFFNKKGDGIFSSVSGKRTCYKPDNLEVIPKNPETGLWGAPFEWANEAVKKLQD